PHHNAIDSIDKVIESHVSIITHLGILITRRLKPIYIAIISSDKTINACGYKY
ncbi:MAG: hypothetical protein HOI31_09935, partial [Gammaproteobacteria bacterium]|nr:hypothetical protein [Gammaproteobacteria bacterium]